MSDSVFSTTNNDNIAEYICDAIEILTEKYISAAPFDKTIKATIISCTSESKGEYKCKHQDAQIIAYASEGATYTEGTMVYILVPRNDMTETKTIIGTVDKLGEDYVRTISQVTKFDPIGDNILNIPSPENIEINTWGTPYDTNIKVLYDKNEEIDLVGLNSAKFQDYFVNSNYESKYFELKADFKTNLEPEQSKDGLYGIRLISQKEGSDSVWMYELNNLKMVGEPLNLVDFTSQRVYFEYDPDKFGEIIHLELFATGFNDGPNPPHIPDIFCQNISITAQHLLTSTELVGTYLSIVTPSGSIFYNTSLDQLQLEARVRINGSIDTSDKIQYYWFIEDTRVYRNAVEPYINNWKKIQGANTEGWRFLNITDRIYTINRRDILAKKVTFKCVAVYDENTTLEREIVVENRTAQYEIIIESSNGNHFYKGSGSTELTCKLYKDGVEFVGPIQYYWGSYTRHGDFIGHYESNWQSATTPTIQADSIDQFERYCCTVYGDNLNIGSGFITLINSDTLDDGGYTLNIGYGDQLFKYNEAGMAPNSESLEIPQQIYDLETNFYNGLGELEDLTNVTTIKWYFPKENTLLVRKHVDEPDFWDDTEPDYYITKAEKLERLDFDITDSFNYNADNNQIKLYIEFNGVTYHTTTSFVFLKEGDLGTNGTEFSCKIVPNTNDKFEESRILIYEKSNGTWDFNFTPRTGEFPFKVQIYQNSKKVFDSYQSGTGPQGIQATVAWEILNPGGTSMFSISGYNFTYNHFPNTIPSTGFNNLIKVTVSLRTQGAKTLYSFLPLGVIKIKNSDYNDTYISLKDGFDRVIYNADGESPAYNTNPLEYHLYHVNDQTTPPTKTEYALNFTIQKRGENLISTSNRYIPSEYYDGIDVSQAFIYNNANLVMYLPVVFTYNRYGLAALNAWDGTSIAINDEDGYIYAPQVGAGKKEEDNSFTGVLIGSVRPSDSLSSDKTGLLAYGHGVRTVFIDADNGKAEFGAGRGKIVLDPNSQLGARIYGGDYDLDPTSGMVIDLNEPSIKWGNGNFEVDKDGMLQAINIQLKRPVTQTIYFQLSKYGYLLDVGDESYPYNLTPPGPEKQKFVVFDSTYDPEVSSFMKVPSNAVAEFGDDGVVLQALNAHSYLRMKNADDDPTADKGPNVALKSGNALYLTSGISTQSGHPIDTGEDYVSNASVTMKAAYNANIWAGHGMTLRVTKYGETVAHPNYPEPIWEDDDTYGYFKLETQYGWLYMSKKAGGKKNTPGIGINAYRATDSHRSDPPGWPYEGQDYKVYINGNEVLTNGNVADATNGDISGVAYVSEFGNIRPYLDKLVSLGSYYEEGDGIAAWRHVVTYDTIQVSDKREKEDIEDMDSRYVDFIMKLRPKRYHYKKTGEKEFRTGFIAQEVEEDLEETGLKNEEFGGLKKKPINMYGDIVDYGYGLNYDDFVAALVLTVQDLQKQINELKEKNYGT